jgi:drug/metabolite transporter (DMT)-like permease
MIIVGTFGALALILKAKAFQNETASRLGIISYLYVIEMLIIDLVIIGTRFTFMEFFGIFIILLSSVVSTALNYNSSKSSSAH